MLSGIGREKSLVRWVIVEDDGSFVFFGGRLDGFRLGSSKGEGEL